MQLLTQLIKLALVEVEVLRYNSFSYVGKLTVLFMQQLDPGCMRNALSWMDARLVTRR